MWIFLQRFWQNPLDGKVQAACVGVWVDETRYNGVFIVQAA